MQCSLYISLSIVLLKQTFNLSISVRHSKNSVGTLSNLKLIFLISVETCAVLTDAVTLLLLKLIDAFPTIDMSILTIRSSLISARYCSLLTVDTLAALVLGRIP
jgi:hypothetical protein